MECMIVKYAFASLALAAASTVPAIAQGAEAPVGVYVENLPTHVRERILDKAQQGRTAVIQYLHRTQSLHQLRPEFILQGDD